MYLFIYLFIFFYFFWGGAGQVSDSFLVPGSLLLLLLCLSAFLFLCFSALPASLLSYILLMLPCFSAFLLFASPASLLFCFFAFPAFLLFCDCASVCAFLLLLFYFSAPTSVMGFGCSTSCSSASSFLSLLSLCFLFSFASFSTVSIPNETLQRPWVKPKETLKKS